MEKKLLRTATILFSGFTIFQIAVFYYSEPIRRMPAPVFNLVGYLLLPGIIVCFILPWSPDLYGSYPALLAFPIAVNSFLYTGLCICLWLLARTICVQPKNL